MIESRRFPTSYTVLAAIAGAILWGLAYPISPFLHLIPFLPDFPVYASPPFQVPLLQLTFSYALAGLGAGSILLLGFRFLPANRERYSQIPVSPAVVLSTLAGLALGGMVAIQIGLLLGSSPTGYVLADRLGFGSSTVEPYLSIGWVIGTALAALVVVSFSGLTRQLTAANRSAFRFAIKTTLVAAGVALLIRLLTSIVQFSSLVTYTLGDSIGVFMIFQVVSGAIFGMIAWIFCSKISTA